MIHRTRKGGQHKKNNISKSVDRSNQPIHSEHGVDLLLLFSNQAGTRDKSKISGYSAHSANQYTRIRYADISHRNSNKPFWSHGKAKEHLAESAESC